MLKALLSKFTRFSEDESGNMSIEALIFVPFILSLLAATFSFYDAFRFKALNTTAAYTISDALSRETAAITPAYLDGMVSTLAFLTKSSSDYSLRVSVVTYDEDSNSHSIDWSQSRGVFSTYVSADMSTLFQQLPTLLHNERVIVVETHTDYEAPFPIDGFITDELFYNFTFTRPRFAPQLIWSGEGGDNIT